MEKEHSHIESRSSGVQKNDLPQPEETVTLNNSTSNVTGDLPGNTKAEDGRPNVPAKVSVSGEGQLSVRERVFDLFKKGCV